VPLHQPSTPDAVPSLTTATLLALKDRVVPLALELGRWAKAQRELVARGEGDLGTHAKTTPGDVVTFVDEEVQRRLHEALRPLDPAFGFVGEEGLDEGEPGAPTWVMDPIDGTHNFVRGYPGFCVSIGLVEGTTPVLGVIYDSVGDDVCWAVQGEGAWRGERRLRVSERADLTHALVGSNFTHASSNDPLHQRLFWAIASRAAGTRSSGAACRDFTLVASGASDLFWQFGLRAWDVAAGIVLVREAGGTVTFAREPGDWVRSPGVDLFVGTEGVVAAALLAARELGAAE
jgi:myo-inositol-1(or 4)-monophosphatase